MLAAGRLGAAPPAKFEASFEPEQTTKSEAWDLPPFMLDASFQPQALV